MKTNNNLNNIGFIFGFYALLKPSLVCVRLHKKMRPAEVKKS